MQEKIQKAIDGEITTEDFTAEELQEYHGALSQKTEEEKKELTGIRSARQAEEQKLQEAQDKAKELEDKKQEEEKNKEPPEGGNEPQQPEQPDPKMEQFRQEQVEKAKTRLRSTVKLSDEELQSVEEKFNRLDSGKLDADLIYEDFLAATAASNPKRYLELIQENEEMEEGASQHTANDAGAHNAPPGGADDKKYSDAVMQYAKENDISPSAAQRQLEQGGMKRTLG